MPSASLPNKDLPPLYHTVDASSLGAQQRFLRATKFRLFFLLAASVCGVSSLRIGVSSTDWAAVGAVISFSAALVTEGYLLRTRPEQTWYEGRAAAESVKTLSWRYAMGGEPFLIGGPHSEDEIEDIFLHQLGSVFEVVKELDVTPSSVGQQITAPMRAVRATSLDDRKRIYEEGRVEDQQRWYQEKAQWNAAWARHWTIIMAAVEVGGVAGAILKAVGAIDSDLLGLFGTFAVAIAAWLQTKQHRSLATAYTVTALELASVRTKIHRQRTEADWAYFVSDAEEAFSREHTLWKASQGVRSI